MMDLLDYIEVNQPKTEKEIEEHFEILKQYFKSKKNIYGAGKSAIPSEINPYLLDFEEKGWIKFYNDREHITIPNNLRDWHTPEEAVDMVVEEIEEAYLKGDYQKALGCRFHPHFEFQSKELSYQYSGMIDQAFDLFAQKLIQEHKALSYFMENDFARGSRLNRFSDKLEKSVIKVASEEIALIQDYFDMKHYFNTHAFFCGLPEHSYRPDIKVILANRLDLVALCEATEPNDIAFILSYTGGCWTSLNSNYKIVYPTGWDFLKVFEETSKPEAVAVIQSEIERLNRLHNHKWG